MDLFVISGMGSYHDLGGTTAINMLNTISLMKSKGARCAAFSQGIGPISRSSAIWRAAERGLRDLDFIALREKRKGPGLLRKLGVSVDRIAVTGDDAIEIAYRLRRPSSAELIGFNVRVAPYSGIADDAARDIARLVSEIAHTLGAGVVPVPISFIPRESDLNTCARILPGNAAVGADDIQPTAESVINRVGQCRIVITGSYHAAVFALAQGIPALCVENSRYYRDKFLGLADMFGVGCKVICLGEPALEERIATAARELWGSAGACRRPLLGAAAVQVAASRKAWRDWGRTLGV